MFLIAITGPDNETHFWSGGETFSVHAEVAVRFVNEVDAFQTIDIIRKALGISPTARVVPMPEGLDD